MLGLRLMAKKGLDAYVLFSKSELLQDLSWIILQKDLREVVIKNS